MFVGSYEATAALTKTQVSSNIDSVLLAALSSKVRLNAKVARGEATITMSGPSDAWFSVAFGSPNFAMADRPWTLVVDGK